VGKVTGFIEFGRETSPKRTPGDRVRDYREIEQLLDHSRVEVQSSRCMDCGIPFCHSFGCPLKNRIPDMNDLLHHKQWRKASELLHSTNNFPEITGRVCPALCEDACTLAVNKAAVSIRLLELHLVERAFKEGWIMPEIAASPTGKRVSIIGSGPAGLAAAQQLARIGHEVVVFEASEKPGGLLRYGIPDFKLEKWVLERRLNQLKEEGVYFDTGVVAGLDLSAKYLRRTFDAILLTTGAREPRDLKVPGRELSGIHFALDFLMGQNCRNGEEPLSVGSDITAQGKRVLVIGGGDTGSDCIGTSRRQGALDIVQIELLPEPPQERSESNPWPNYPQILKTTSSHEEGCTRSWSVLTKAFEGEKGQVRKVHCVKLEWITEATGKKSFREIPGSDFIIEADLVLLATGFVHAEHNVLMSDLALEFDAVGNVKTVGGFQTTVPGVFAAGDCIRGPSLVVHAINSGRNGAAEINEFLKTRR